ncbi:MAG: 5'-nucleotidase, lipoprotein e(P4) family [Flavobacteriales bacterium]|nr:5'-nucleotidase, lipoprotein e(P4) family [Flavobacteriales bacterium]
MKYLSLLLSVVFMASCAMPSPEPTPTPEVTRMPVKEHVVSSVLWQQHSAEYRALCYQAFNIAALRLQQLEGASEKPLAIITDIDETVLDNSPYSGMQVQEDLEFDKNDWIEWGKQQSAPEVPGAVEFFNFADSLGVEVFYISNRYHVQIDETLANMQALDLPNADTSHVFLKTETSEKQARRDRVLNDYEVVLYLGDNLSDFSSVFDGQGTAARNQSAKDLQASFGDQFIVFPNPMYGDWESKGIYEAGRDWSSSEMDSIRKSKIRSFR